MRVRRFCRPLLKALAAAILASILVLPSAAHAFWRGGVFFGFPLVVVGPPVHLGAWIGFEADPG